MKKYKLGNLLYNKKLIVRYNLNSSGKTLASKFNKNKLVTFLKYQSLSSCTQLNGNTISQQIPFQEIIHTIVYAYHNWIEIVFWSLDMQPIQASKYTLLLNDIVRHKLNMCIVMFKEILATGVNKTKRVIKSNLNHYLVISCSRYKSLLHIVE